MNREEQGNFGWANIGALIRSRSDKRQKLNLGIVPNVASKGQVFRSAKLDKYDAYYDCKQYDHLQDWDAAVEKKGDYVAVRRRKPRIIYPFSKTLSQRLAAKLIGKSVFPTFKIEESPDDQAFLAAVVKETGMRSAILEPIRKCINTGSIFLRFKIDNGGVVFEEYDAKFCYPEFRSGDELESIEIKYVYLDWEDKDTLGNPKRKWWRMVLNTETEIMYDNPLYEEGKEPTFQVVEQYDHGFAFVQGQWFRTSKQSKCPDGYGVVSEIMGFIDEICYSLSQSSQAVGYNQDPVLWFKNMTEEERGGLIRSVTKAWDLGRNGEAGFLESDLAGVERAGDLRDKVVNHIGDITRIVIHDPDKIVGSAQSAKAMEILHGPLKDLIDELRESMEGQFKTLVIKVGMVILLANRMGIEVPIAIPAGYIPQSFNVDVIWPPIFQQTMEDLQKKVQVASAATAASILSRESATRWLAKDFDIEDVEAELQKIAAQPILNPFGSF